MKIAHSLPAVLVLTSALALTACASRQSTSHSEAQPAMPVSSAGGMTGVGYAGPGQDPVAVEAPTEKVVVREVNPNRPIVIRVTGSGAPPYTKTLTPTQRKLLALRSARLDAYRAMAEQVQGVRLSGGSSVSNLLAVSDSFRVYVDAYLRGIRILSTNMMPDGSSEAMAELTLDQEFYQAYRRALMETGSVKKAAEVTAAAGTECKGSACGDASPSLGNNYYMAQ